MAWLTLSYQFFCLQLLLLCSVSFAKLCSHDQSHALLQFKQLFSFRNSSSSYCLPSYPKMISWQENSDCCSWDGVTCDKETGNVIGLDLSCSWLHGNIPSNSSLFFLPHLQTLNLAYNDFNHSQIPTSFSHFLDLTLLNLSSSGLSGELPNAIGNLMSLRYLDLFNCNCVGSVPASLGRLTQLIFLDLSFNNFSGHIPSSLSNLKNLQVLRISENKFIGEIPDIFVNLTQLYFLSFQCNQLAGPIPSQASMLQDLAHFSLYDNFLSGSVPSWLFTLPQLEYIDLGYNQLTGHIVEFQSNFLHSLYLDRNRLHGSIPVLPPKLKNFLISNNNLTGRIPHLICNVSSIEILDFYNNNLFGTIPECIGNLSNSLQVFDLQKNRFYGRIPNTFAKGSNLRTLNFNENGLEGPVPQSLGNCMMLEVLDLGNNNIHDTFPYWLGSLPKLQVLILRSNKFYGFVRDSSENRHSFAKLRIFDLSSNNFSGPLPEKYLTNLKAMMNVSEKAEGTVQYMGDGYYKDSVKITLKGTEIELIKIPPTFTSIDFSNNKFNGEIGEVVGTLHALRSLNLSQNSLIGCIPPSFENMIALESLDLSSNKLVGKIPWQLTKLNFLQVLNLSQNQLTGPIPRATHFDTFPNNSYSGNLGLCGFPLSNTCDTDDKPPQPFSILEDDTVPAYGFGWKVVLLGYVCGMVFGMIIGYLVFSTGKPCWLLNIVEGKHHRKVRRSNLRREGRKVSACMGLVAHVLDEN